MSKKKAKAQVNEFDETLAASKSFFEKNKKAILYGGGSVLAIIILALLIHQFYITPRNLKANESIFYAEQAFMDGNYEKHWLGPLVLSADCGGETGVFHGVTAFVFRKDFISRHAHLVEDA